MTWGFMQMIFKRSLHIFYVRIYLKPVSIPIFISTFEGKIIDPRCTGEIKNLKTEEIIFYTEIVILFFFNVKEDTQFAQNLDLESPVVSVFTVEFNMTCTRIYCCLIDLVNK